MKSNELVKNGRLTNKTDHYYDREVHCSILCLCKNEGTNAHSCDYHFDIKYNRDKIKKHLPINVCCWMDSFSIPRF